MCKFIITLLIILLSFSSIATLANAAQSALPVNCVTGCSGGSGGSSTTTVPTTLPTPAPGATGNPLYSNQNGDLRVAQTSVSTTLTTSNLTANSVYTSGWIDSNATNQKFITITAYTSATQGGTFVIEYLENQSQSFLSSGTSTVVGGTPYTSSVFYVPTRYWRVVYTNGTTNQTSFELDETQSSIPVNNTTITGGANTTTIPSSLPNNSPSTTGVPLYSNAEGDLRIVFGGQGSVSTNPAYTTDPNINQLNIAQDGAKNQGVYIAGSGQGSISTTPLYSTDPNLNKLNTDSNGNLLVTGNGNNNAVTTNEDFSTGVEYEGASLTSTASTITFTNPYSKLIITAYGFSTTTTVANCNFGAVATNSTNGGLALPDGVPITVPWKVTTGSTTVSCIMVTGTGSITIAAFR